MLERSESQAILDNLEVGVAAFGSDGVLLSANTAVRCMLPDIPVHLQKFLDFYGRENGVQASLLLGNLSAQGHIWYADRVFYMVVQKRHLSRNRSAGTIILLQDVTEQERQEKQRKDFVANVSHELKTPLTTIKSYTESLLDWGLAEKSPEAVERDVKRIYDDSLRMETLIADLLLLSSIDSKGLYTRFEEVDPVHLVRQIVERVFPQAEAKAIQLTSHVVSQVSLIFADRSAIDRVLVNLVTNAIKYTDEGGDIRVYIGQVTDDIYVKVRDNGRGIPLEDQERIFERFYRVDTTGSRQYGGTGLGLSIARELVQLHRGKLTVSSALGQGSEFILMLPSAHKSMREAFIGLTGGERRTDLMTRAAEQEWTQIKEDLGISTGWKHLSGDEAAALVAKIEHKEDNMEDYAG